MTRKLQQHHVVALLKSTGLVTDQGHRALSAGDVIYADLEFLTRFANQVREVQVMAPGERPQFVGYTDKTPRQVIGEYLHPRVPANLQYRTCCDHPDCTTCAGHGGFYRFAAPVEQGQDTAA